MLAGALIALLAASSGVLAHSPSPNAARHAQVARSHAHLVARGCSRMPSSVDERMRDIIYETTRRRSQSHRVMVATMATAYTESMVNNLDCGDKRSHGLFQQQAPGFTWGTVAQTLDPVHATNAFLDVLLPLAERNPNMPANVLAQTVQQAEAGDQYHRHLSIAEGLAKDAEAVFSRKEAGREEARRKKALEEARKAKSRASLAAAKTRSSIEQKSITSSIRASQTRSLQASITSAAIAKESSEAAAAASSSSAAAAAAALATAGNGGAINVAGAPKAGSAQNAAPAPINTVDGAPSSSSRLTASGSLAVLLAAVSLAAL